MAAEGVPPAEVEIDEALARRLLAEQHPDLADRPMALLANGWDNVIFRLGDDLVVRLPRRQLGADLVANELRWLPELAERLPLPVPAPVRSGTATAGYPWAWTVCPFFPGDVAADVTLHEPTQDAERLGTFLAALHVEAPPEAPHNPVRGHRVADLDERFAANVGRLGGLADAAPLRRRWQELAGVAEWDGPRIWFHGDLHSANTIVVDGAISAVIDFGDVAAGDPAVDLTIAWMLFDAADRQRFRAAAGARLAVDEATWERAQLWGLHFAVLYLLHSADNERFERMGRRLLRALLA